MIFYILHNFKYINDSYGHLAGDKVLVILAEILLKNIRKSDIAARYGGEEFAILVPHTNLEDTEMTAERLRSEVEATVVSNDKSKALI